MGSSIITTAWCSVNRRSDQKTSDYEFSRLFPRWLTRSLQLPPYFWNINGYSVAHEVVDFVGWALPWYGRPFNRILRRNDGIGVDIASTVDKDMASHFPYWANAPTAPFTARTKIGLDHADYISIECADASDVSSLAHPLDQFSKWLFIPTTKDLPVPAANIISHIGKSSPDYYLMSGCTLFNGFKSAFERYTGRAFRSAKRVLDWGCGPGRIGLHLTKEILTSGATTEYVGVDIDLMSLTWAERTVKGKLVHTQLMPPLPFENESFDFIFGYSVFTHLDQPVQEAWLRELHRICERGGIVALTVMSELAMFFFEPFLTDADALERFDGGIYAVRPNTQLEESGISGDYYRNVWMTHDFIIQHWARHFEVVGLHPNFHHYQDLVVLRAR